MQFTPQQKILWLANVRALPFRERIRVAAKGGFGWLTTSPHDYDQTRASGLTARDMRMIAADQGVVLTYLDPLTSWVPDWQPDDMSEEMHAYLQRDPDEFFRIAEALRVDAIHVIGTFPEGRYDVEYLAERYAAVCDRAADQGMRCTIEAIPHWGLKKLSTVWQIVSKANRINGGIVFDNWHYLRAGREDSLLSTLPSGAIATVQLADGTGTLPEGRSLIEDCVFYRRPLGEGEMPIMDVLTLLKTGGHLSSVGLEIFSAELDELDADAICERITPGFNRVLEAV